MRDLKQMAATAAVEWIEEGMVVGVGAGATIAYLVEALKKERALVESVIFLPISLPVTEALVAEGFKIGSIRACDRIDLYFDSCDQLDYELNAWKSGGGIHTREKVLASMADDFVLLADAPKLAPKLTAEFPLVLEVFPEVVATVKREISRRFPGVGLTLRGAEIGEIVITGGDHFLLEARFPVLPALEELNALKMLPGVVEHSLFYRIASKAIVAAYKGVEVLMAGR